MRKEFGKLLDSFIVIIKKDNYKIPKIIGKSLLLIGSSVLGGAMLFYKDMLSNVSFINENSKEHLTLLIQTIYYGVAIDLLLNGMFGFFSFISDKTKELTRDILSPSSETKEVLSDKIHMFSFLSSLSFSVVVSVNVTLDTTRETVEKKVDQNIEKFSGLKNDYQELRSKVNSIDGRVDEISRQQPITPTITMPNQYAEFLEYFQHYLSRQRAEELNIEENTTAIVDIESILQSLNNTVEEQKSTNANLEVLITKQQEINEDVKGETSRSANASEVMVLFECEKLFKLPNKIREWKILERVNELCKPYET